MAFQKTLHKQGKLQLYTRLKKRPGFKNYLKLPNQKLSQAIIISRIRAHKLPIETGRFVYRKWTEVEVVIQGFTSKENSNSTLDLRNAQDLKTT